MTTFVFHNSCYYNSYYKLFYYKPRKIKRHTLGTRYRASGYVFESERVKKKTKIKQSVVFIGAVVDIVSICV